MVFSRRTLQTLLGLFWLIDGVLQLKPQMFSKTFVTQVILPTAAGQPNWIANSVTWAAHLVTPHIAFYNFLFALIQLLLGVCLIFNMKLKTTLVISFVWTLLVWWFGEGFGQLLTGQASLLMGAPGAVLLYGLIGWSVWPTQMHPHKEMSERGKRTASLSLGVLWMLGAFLHLQSTYLTPSGFRDMISSDWITQLIGSHGLAVNFAVAILELAIGIGVLVNRRIRWFMGGSIVLSFLFWWLGQSYGQMFTPLGTDPNAGPLFILLTLCACPEILGGREAGQRGLTIEGRR